MAANAEKQPVEDRNLDRSGEILDNGVYDRMKSAENKRRVLGVFMQKLISVRSGRGLRPTSLPPRANYTTCDYSSLSRSLRPTALRLRL